MDVMPTDPGVLGLENRWFAAAVAHATRVSFTDGQVLRVVSAPYFCATKLEAFADRGAGDPPASVDLEDFLTIVDGRAELVAEVAASDPAVRNYLAAAVRGLLDTPALIDALPGHLPGDAASQARLPLLLARLRAVAAFGAS